MALNKRIKVGGGYYKGHTCSVLSASGSYTVVLENTSGAAMNGISITPDAYGKGDTMNLVHYAGSSGAGDVIAVLAEDINNAGKNASILLDFPAAELISSSESIIFTYINTASVAMNVYLLAEYVGVQKTALG